jgi:fimbrial chaperone protein
MIEFVLGALLSENNMKNIHSKLIYALFGLFLTPSVFAAAANIGFSEYRILLTAKEKHRQLIVFNKGNDNAQCDLGLNHFNIADDNSFTAQAKPELAFNSAYKLLRYSPRRVSIPANSSQKVKLSFRRRANLAPGEYTSYLNMVCKVDEGVTTSGEMGSVISYNIPVHLRVGELTASTNFEVLTIDKTEGTGYRVMLRQSREGNRSIVGDLLVTDIKSGKAVLARNGMGFYQPATYVDHQILLDYKPVEGLQINFTEIKKYGGNLAQNLIVEGDKF